MQYTRLLDVVGHLPCTHSHAGQMWDKVDLKGMFSCICVCATPFGGVRYHPVASPHPPLSPSPSPVVEYIIVHKRHTLTLIQVHWRGLAHTKHNTYDFPNTAPKKRLSAFLSIAESMRLRGVKCDERCLEAFYDIANEIRFAIAAYENKNYSCVTQHTKKKPKGEILQK